MEEDTKLEVLERIMAHMQARRTEIDAAYLQGSYKQRAIEMFELEGEAEYESFIRIVLKMQAIFRQKAEWRAVVMETMMAQMGEVGDEAESNDGEQGVTEVAPPSDVDLEMFQPGTPQSRARRFNELISKIMDGSATVQDNIEVSHPLYHVVRTPTHLLQLHISTATCV
eukprot:COSAG05_NODE_623_length_8291_cov_4.353394_9_plen_169_part_00